MLFLRFLFLFLSVLLSYLSPPSLPLSYLSLSSPGLLSHLCYLCHLSYLSLLSLLSPFSLLSPLSPVSLLFYLSLLFSYLSPPLPALCALFYSL